jgi:glycosyltransferase involved in cell wall biosynthesis
MLGVSVIICCYNSANRLPETLKHLALQKDLGNIAWEVIIVDNASTDNTLHAAVTEWQKYSVVNGGFKVVTENTPGLSHARQKGIDQSQFDYIIFCDDDNWLNESYLSIAYDIMQSKPQVGALGGHNIPVTDGQLPDWFEPYQGWYAAGKQATKTGDVSERMYVWGAGMVLRKDLFTKALGKVPSLLSDRKGNALTSGGDAEICKRLLFMGYTLFYDDSLVLKHYMPPDRLTIAYRERLIQGISESNKILGKYIELIHLYKLSSLTRFKIFILSLVKIFLSRIKLIRSLSLDYETTMVYFIGGLKFKELWNETILVKEAYNSLRLYAYK